MNLVTQHQTADALPLGHIGTHCVSLKCYRDEEDEGSAHGPVPHLLGTRRWRQVHSGGEQRQLHSGWECANGRRIRLLVSVIELS